MPRKQARVAPTIKPGNSDVHNVTATQRNDNTNVNANANANAIAIAIAIANASADGRRAGKQRHTYV